MMRMQIQLTTAQHRLLKRRARRVGVSVSEIVRRSIDAALQTPDADIRAERVQRALALAGKYADAAGPGDIARQHDAAFVDAAAR